jgi:hypothetical protein
VSLLGFAPLAGEIVFSFVRKRDGFILQMVFACPAGDCFSACPAGAKTTFSFDSKEKAVLDSEKEKVDQWKSWGGAVQPYKAPILLGYPSGKRL